MKVSIFNCSPKSNGSCSFSTQLIEDCLKKQIKEQIETEIINVRDFDVQGCDGCNVCKTQKRCKFVDDAEKLLLKFKKSDVVFLIAPVYYCGLDSHTKALVDRSQVFWNVRQSISCVKDVCYNNEIERLLDPTSTEYKNVMFKSPKTFLILIGGQNADSVFSGPEHTMKAFCYVMNADLVKTLVLKKVDTLDDMHKPKNTAMLMDFFKDILYKESN